MIPKAELFAHRAEWERKALGIFQATLDEEQVAVGRYGRRGFDVGLWISAFQRVWVGAGDPWHTRVRSLIDEEKAIRDEPGLWDQLIALITKKAVNVVELSEEEWLAIGEGVWTAERAVTMAGTEVVQSIGFAQHGAAVGSGAVLFKVWQSIIDERTRPTHLDANGQRQLLNDPFDVGGAALQWPADAGGPLSEIINCRCWEDYELALESR